MKKEKTSSYFTWICERNGKKFVRSYKRNNKKLHGYPRTIPVNKILKLLKNTNIKYPSVLFNLFKYIDLEYIDGKEVDSNVNNKFIIDMVISYMSQLTLIDCHKIFKYITWENNTDYLHWLIKHILNIFNSKSYLIKVYNSLGINDNIISKYLDCRLDDDRELSLVHGDLHRGNMLLKDKVIYLLDWELATYGDIAYELATHFILMNYSDEERQYFLSRLCQVKGYDFKKLLNDIKIYCVCEYFRRTIMKIDKLIEYIKSGKDYKKILNNVYFEYSQLLLLLERKNKYSIIQFEKIVIDEGVKNGK